MCAHFIKNRGKIQQKSIKADWCACVAQARSYNMLYNAVQKKYKKLPASQHMRERNSNSTNVTRKLLRGQILYFLLIFVAKKCLCHLRRDAAKSRCKSLLSSHTSQLNSCREDHASERSLQRPLHSTTHFKKWVSPPNREWHLRHIKASRADKRKKRRM